MAPTNATPWLLANLVAVLHELRQVEQSLRDLRDVLGGERQLDAADELVLLILAQLRPAREEGGVEQVPVNRGRFCTFKTGPFDVDKSGIEVT